MESSCNRIKDYISGTNQYKIINISHGILITRYVLEEKIKFKSLDLKLLPKDFLNIKNTIRKKYPLILNKNLEPEKSLEFLFVSPFFADKAKSYKEELYLICIDDVIPEGERLKSLDILFPEITCLENLEEDMSYLVLKLGKNNKIIDKKVFYCERYQNYLTALKNTSFSHFLSIVKTERITDSNTLISCLAKEGIPAKVQEKYLEYWQEYDYFLDIINDLCYEIERKRAFDISILKNLKNPRGLNNFLIKELNYDSDRAKNLLSKIRNI